MKMTNNTKWKVIGIGVVTIVLVMTVIMGKKAEKITKIRENSQKYEKNTKIIAGGETCKTCGNPLKLKEIYIVKPQEVILKYENTEK